MKKVIYLQKIGDIDDKIIKNLKKDLTEVFKDFIDAIEILPNILPLKNSNYDEERDQYEGTSLLDGLEQILENKNYLSTLGVLNRDIFSRNKKNKKTNYVFGIARKRKTLETTGVSLISITRLKEKFYRRREKKRKERMRILKEAVHEIGHTLKLEHCKNYCVMKYSNSLMEAEKKPIEFCKSCLKKLELFLKGLNSGVIDN